MSKLLLKSLLFSQFTALGLLACSNENTQNKPPENTSDAENSLSTDDSKIKKSKDSTMDSNPATNAGTSGTTAKNTSASGAKQGATSPAAAGDHFLQLAVNFDGKKLVDYCEVRTGEAKSFLPAGTIVRLSETQKEVFYVCTGVTHSRYGQTFYSYYSEENEGFFGLASISGHGYEYKGLTGSERGYIKVQLRRVGDKVSSICGFGGEDFGTSTTSTSWVAPSSGLALCTQGGLDIRLVDPSDLSLVDVHLPDGKIKRLTLQKSRNLLPN